VSGPSVSTDDSKQDYGTPWELIDAVTKRFGPISFDLAAHANNKKHPRYFAPEFFYEVGTAAELGLTSLEVLPDGVVKKRKDKKTGAIIFERRVKNVDPEAYGIDAFKHEWWRLSDHFGEEHPSGRALLWDNCEWADVEPWAKKHKEEMSRGANSLLLTHVAISNWYADHIAGHADVYQCLGRMSFDGKNVYPKDCMLSHFHPGATGDLHLWDWRRDTILATWKKK